MLLKDQTTSVFTFNEIDRLVHGQTVTCEALNKAGSGKQTSTVTVNC